MVAFGAVQKRTYALIETGEYVWTLQDVGEISGDYGDRMQWDFLVALKEDPTGYICNANGNERVLRFFTDQEITLGSRQHEWIQALTGKSYGVDADLPDGDELLSKRMIAYLTHYTPKKGKNAGVPKEDIVAGSAKPFKLPTAKTNGPALANRSVPAEPDVPDADRTALIADIKRQIRRAALADVDPSTVEQWKALDLPSMSMQDLEDGLVRIEQAIEMMQEA